MKYSCTEVKVSIPSYKNDLLLVKKKVQVPQNSYQCKNKLYVTESEYNKQTTQILAYLNVANCVSHSVTKWADFKFVLLLNVS